MVIEAMITSKNAHFLECLSPRLIEDIITRIFMRGISFSAEADRSHATLDT